MFCRCKMKSTVATSGGMASALAANIGNSRGKINPEGGCAQGFTRTPDFRTVSPVFPLSVAAAMKSTSLKFAVVATCIALLRAPALGNHDQSNHNDLVPASFKDAAGTTVTANLTWGELMGGRVIETQTMLGRHTATEYQRRIAERNAKVFFKQLTPAKRVELRNKHVRTVLIPTVRSRETSPKAKAVMMRFSMEGEALVDPEVYEFEAQPPAGTVARYTGGDPEYVGL